MVIVLHSVMFVVCCLFVGVCCSPFSAVNWLLFGGLLFCWCC